MSLLQYYLITANITLCSFHSLFKAKRVISESWPSRKRVSKIYLVVVLSFRRFGVCKISSNSFSSSSSMLTSSTTYWSPLLCKKIMKSSVVYETKLCAFIGSENKLYLIMLCLPSHSFHALRLYPQNR